MPRIEFEFVGSGIPVDTIEGDFTWQDVFDHAKSKVWTKQTYQLRLFLGHGGKELCPSQLQVKSNHVVVIMRMTDPKTPILVKCIRENERCMQLLYDRSCYKDIKILLILKADPNERTLQYNEKNMLHYTAWYNDVEICKLLLEAKANPDARTFYGNTPLHYTENDEIVKLLISAKADVNAMNNKNATPLLRFAYKGSVGPARLLLEAKANPNIKNIRGESPLSVCTNDEIAQLLSL